MGSGEKPGEYLRVASYNIHSCIGNDRHCDPLRIAEVIKELGATLIGLQEVDTHALNDILPLTRSLGFEAVVGPTMTRQNGHYGNCLLTRHPILSICRIDLSVSRREPRGALCVELDVRGNPVKVVVIHLGLTTFERHRQAKRLAETIATDDGRLSILLGDFNEWAGWTRTLRFLRSNFGRSKALRTFPSWFPILSLDRVFVRPGRALIRATVHSSAISRVASDHLPVTALIRVQYERKGMVQQETLS